MRGEIDVKRILWMLALAGLLTLSQSALAADSADHADKGDQTAQKKHETPVPKEVASVTHGDVRIGNRDVHYTATAGNLVIHNDKGEPTASFFYVAYTADHAGDARKRPVTFLYNGGPGSSSIWLHMGAFGPVRVAVADGTATPPPPYNLVANHDSLLDKTDLVFIDAIGTGFSKAVGKAKGKDFFGVDQDVDAFARFIQRYITVNQRWDSPKFLYGESYGTTRSAALAAHLQDMGIALNGVTLMSSILNYGLLLPGSDMRYQLYLPTYAAIAWYHHKLPQQPADLKAFLDGVRHFADTDYARALAQGQNLPQAEADAVAQKLHQYTGLSVEYLKRTHLRVDAGRFRKELLRDEARTVGRYDGRFMGIDEDSAGETPDYDPSDTAISPAFTAAFNAYLDGTLKYKHDQPYKVMADAIKDWDWKHRAAGSRRKMPMPYVAGDLAQAMRENPGLRVFSANGYFDLATPFHVTEYDIDHMELDPSIRGHVTFGYYPSGHMIYLHPEALHALKADLAKFYDMATPAP
jgi:carboxypeptidase C (cathepsin A)